MSDYLDPRAIMRNNDRVYPGNPSYAGFGANAAPPATPTDMFGLQNPANSGKIIAVRYFGMLAGATAASLVELFFKRRSALNTNGTPTAITAAKYDSADAAAVGVFQRYTVNPTINDAAAVTCAYMKSQTATLAASYAQMHMFAQGPGGIVNINQDVGKPFVIRPGEELVCNFAGAALPGGFTFIPLAQWAEYTIPA